MEVLRKSIWTADLKTAYVGSSIQTGIRPVIVVSNDVNNFHCRNIDVLALTTQIKNNLPTHVVLNEDCGLLKISVAMAEQECKIPKTELRTYIGIVDEDTMQKINKAIQIQKGIINPFNIKKAYMYLDSLREINSFINKLRKYNMLDSEETISKRSLTNEFKDYCSDYDIDYKIILKQYNEQYRNNYTYRYQKAVNE